LPKVKPIVNHPAFNPLKMMRRLQAELEEDSEIRSFEDGEVTEGGRSVGSPQKKRKAQA
jgi:hypothetical protein